jgi:hypothetical protein
LENGEVKPTEAGLEVPVYCGAHSGRTKQLVQMASQHVQPMHKALMQMNLQIHHVIDDITGCGRTCQAGVKFLRKRDRGAGTIAGGRHDCLAESPTPTD